LIFSDVIEFQILYKYTWSFSMSKNPILKQ
jgi:hypothetical protein